MLGIKNYIPVFYDNEQRFIEANKETLNSICGETLNQIFWVWDEVNNEWFTDCPVILKLNSMQISICNFKFDEIALGCNDINMSEALDWYGCDFDLEWREYEFSGKERLLFHSIKDYKIIYDKMTIDNRNLDILAGVGFYINNCCLAITNGLDCNKIEFFDSG